MEIEALTVWKTVKLGLHKSPHQYRTAITSARMRIGLWGDEMLDTISLSSEEVGVDLVVLSVGGLGFEHSARYSDICAKGLDLGLVLCPAEVGPALRLQIPDQPQSKGVLVAAEAIACQGGGDRIFSLQNANDALSLDGCSGYSGSYWGTGFRFVFVLP